MERETTRRLFILLLLGAATPALSAQDSCNVPLDETKSAPADDLSSDGHPLDPGYILTRIAADKFDSSSLEPNLSSLYVGTPQPIETQDASPFPNSDEILFFQNELGGADGLVRARVSANSLPGLFFQLQFSLDSHATLARNALLRQLGYAIPIPRHYTKLRVQFKSLDERNRFINSISDGTLTSRGRWIDGGFDALTKNELIVSFQDVVLEPAIILVPPFHWGILKRENIDARRSIRALIVPLTLLDIPESVNMYSFEGLKVFNEHLVFSRNNASVFDQETSIGDVKWIAKKIAQITPNDWKNIIRAAKYPPDIEAIVFEKTLARVNQLMALLNIKNFTPFSYNGKVTVGSVIEGKVTQEFYPGFAARFTYGDPENPLRASELVRFFGINAISGAIGSVLEKATDYLQVITPDHYINRHNEQLVKDLSDHFQKSPNEPYIQPIRMWGGPIAGAAVNASRNIVTGTYYGSESQAQLVDSISASVAVGGFFGVSGIKNLGLALNPQIQYSRSYVHVRPLDYSTNPLNTAWKENWGHLLVPKFMHNLYKILSGGDDDAGVALRTFFASMNPGEMFIVTDGFAGGAGVMAQIPLGAMIGIMPAFGQLSVGGSVQTLYGVLSRTTITRTKEGVQIYLTRAHSKTFALELNAQFFVKLIAAGIQSKSGTANTEAFVLPESFEDPEKDRALKTALRAILKNQNSELLKEEFSPYHLDHSVKMKGNALTLGPWTRTHQEIFHRLEVTPPIDPLKLPHPEEHKRVIIQGQTQLIRGTDIFGFLGDGLRSFVSWLRLGSRAQGIDPSANFLGRAQKFFVNTEIEVTPNRSNQMITRVQKSFSGWTIRKNRMLRVIRRISDEFSNLSGNPIYVNEDEFSQTKTIQSFDLGSTLLIYPRGIESLLSPIDLNQTGTIQTYVFLVNLQGQENYRKYCESRGLNPALMSGPFHRAGQGEDGSWIESSRGRMTRIGCITPLMKSVFRLRQDLRNHPEVFQADVHEESVAKEKIRWINRIIYRLHEEIDLGMLISWMKKGNSFFQLRLSGFRTQDERGDSEYFANTLGRIDDEFLVGPLSDISSTSKISVNELEARYLSNGF